MKIEELKRKVAEFELPEKMAFGKVKSPVMVKMSFSEGSWSKPKLMELKPILMDPFAKVLHYGQEIFEGMKAYKNQQEEVFLFRTKDHLERFNRSATRMSMPSIPVEEIRKILKEYIGILSPLIPQSEDGYLYIRPFMIATEESLGTRASKTYDFYIISNPYVDHFVKKEAIAYVEEDYIRAGRGGTGAAKCGGNYATALRANEKMKEKGANHVLWLDAEYKKNVEEFSAMNFFSVINGELVTPKLSDSILQGITRDSLITLAKKEGLTVREEDIPINRLIQKIESGECTEIFGCGTFAVISSIDRIIYQEKSLKLPEDKTISKKLKKELSDIHRGRTINDWQEPIDEK